jgi:hypothetical protein
VKYLDKPPVIICLSCRPRENITHKFVAHCKVLTHVGNRWSKLFQVDPRPLRLGTAFNGSNYFCNDLQSSQLVTSQTMDFVDCQNSWFIQSEASPNFTMPWNQLRITLDQRTLTWISKCLEWATNLCMQFSSAWSRACKDVNLFELHKRFFLSQVLRPKLSVIISGASSIMRKGTVSLH